MPPVFPTVACNLDNNILGASLPLFEAGRVEAIQWSFDALYLQDEIPDWFQQLLQTYSAENRLIGHGVFFSLFSAKWMPEQQLWLDTLRQFSKKYQFNHISEHFGYMTGQDFHKGAPLPIPYTAETLALGIDRLKRIQEACNCPVGLENLAFAYSIDDVKRHGEFLLKLVESVNGFIILDLHNVYCQTQNFKIDFDKLLNLYPLDRVKEIHISGGSWESSEVEPDITIRRDTHDDGVPAEVFEYLKKAIPLCPNLKFVTMEQLGTGLATEENQTQFRSDFIQMQEIINSFQKDTSIISDQNSFLPNHAENILSTEPIENELLFQQQMQLSSILENAHSAEQARQLLRSSSLAQSEWEIEKWNISMLETAMKIAQKWKEGFNSNYLDN